MGDTYFWGAPTSKRERAAAAEAIKKVDLDKRFDLMNFYMNRVTDKTSGLITMAGLVFAISLYVLERQFSLLVAASSLMAMWGILLLSMNLGSVWRKDQSNWNPTQRLIEDQIHVFSRRVVRLQLALWLIVLSSVMSFLALMQTQPGLAATISVYLEQLRALLEK